MVVGTRDYKETHSAVSSVPIDVTSGDQDVEPGCRGIHCNVSGTLHCKLIGDVDDSEWVLVAGNEYALVVSVIREETDAEGNVMF